MPSTPEVLGRIIHGVGLSQDQGSGLIVHGQEDQISAVVLGIRSMNGEVSVVAVGEGGVRDNLEGRSSLAFCMKVS